MSYLLIFKLTFSAISACCYFIAATVKIPTPPKSGDPVSAEYPNALTKMLKRISKFSALGAVFIAITLLLECIQLIF